MRFVRQKSRSPNTYFVRITTLLLSAKLFTLALAVVAWAAPLQVEKPYFGIHVVDGSNDRGVPLVELRTVNDVSYWTDSQGWVAFHEPDLMDRDVFFHVATPGYEFPSDGFGYRGVRLQTTPGNSATIQVRRTNLAERICRMTGQGIDRDTRLLGLATDRERDQAITLGQDSVQAVPFADKIFWLWGDTNLAHYPLGNFHTTAATSRLPTKETEPPENGVRFEYYLDATTGFVAPMIPDSQPGAVWLFGLMVVPNESGHDELLAHYSRHLSLAEVAEHGLVRFNSKSERFEKLKTIDLAEKWRYPRGNAVRVNGGSGDYFYFCEPFATTRVKAYWASVIDPQAYEALHFDEATSSYRWQTDLEPTTQQRESELLIAGEISAGQCRYRCLEAASGSSIEIHRASINWNKFLNKWLLIGNQAGDANAASRLGQVWMATADEIAGPWHTAIKIASHPNFSFYNPRQHTFFDSADGRYVYFEGTFTRTFSGSVAIPRYEYNQLLYRLDLSNKRISGQ